VSVAWEDEITEQFAFPCEASRIFCVCLEKQGIETKTPARRRAEILLINGWDCNIMPVYLPSGNMPFPANNGLLK
jgi:hypothetical protein